MRNPGCVIAQVIDGKAPKLAEVLEVSESRCYEILSTDNPSPKTKRLIRAIAQVEGITAAHIGLIKADYDAMFADLMGEIVVPGSISECHKESGEGVQAGIDEKPLAEQIREAREAQAAWTARIARLEREERDAKKRDLFPGQKVSHNARSLGAKAVEKRSAERG